MPDPQQFEPDQFPAELTEVPQWVLWQWEPSPRDPEKLTKVPKQVNGANASSTDASTWSSFEEVVRHRNGFAGVGFVPDEKFVFIDADHCIDEHGNVDLWAESILDQLDSYAELSPSRTGLHIWARGSLPEGRRKVGSLEMYVTGRFGTVTGWHLDGTPHTINACDLRDLHRRMEAGEFVFSLPSKLVAPLPPIASASGSHILLDKFSSLQAGRWEGIYNSHSEADTALVGYLSRDLHTAAEIDAAFRKTGLMRPKWDAARGTGTYGSRTIEYVLASRQSAPTPEAPVILIHSAADVPDPRSISSPPVRFLVEGMIPANMYIMIAGAEGIGKSYVTMMLGAALARGERFLDRETMQCEKVLYIDREMPLALVKERMSAIFGESEENIYHHWGMWMSDEPPAFDSPRWKEFAAPGAVLIFDSYSRFHSGNENKPSEMVVASAYLRKMQALGATVICLHHRDKKMEAGYRGSTEISAATDVLYTLSKEKEDRWRLKVTKSRTAVDDNITFKIDFDLPALLPVENALVVRRREQCVLISGILRGRPEGVRQSVIIEHLGLEGVSRTHVQRLLEQHEGKLWISSGGGRGVPCVYREKMVLR
jgi:putative DNA primase/helicase